MSNKRAAAHPLCMQAPGLAPAGTWLHKACMQHMPTHALTHVCVLSTHTYASLTFQVDAVCWAPVLAAAVLLKLTGRDALGPAALLAVAGDAACLVQPSMVENLAALGLEPYLLQQCKKESNNTRQHKQAGQV